ncbi:TolC family protein, partial [bacterium]|nr:TolC family protein [bacterium]
MFKCIKHAIIILLILGIIGLNDAGCAASASIKSGVSKQQKNKEDEKKFELYHFWENYMDEYLSSYVFEALEKNPSLKIANDRLRQSQALLGTINAQRLPHIGVGTNVYPYKSLSGKNYNSYNDISMPLFFNWEIDIFGKLSDKVQSGRYDVKIAKENVNINKLSLTSEVCAMYFNIILTDELIENEEEILKNLEEVLKLKKQLYEGGIIKYDDLYITEYEKINTQTELNALYKQRDILSHAFSFIRAAAPKENINHRTMEQMTLPFLPDAEINSDLVFNRPDVIQAEYAIKKAAFDVKVAKKMFLPSFNLNEIVGFESFRASRLLNWDSIVYQIGAGMLLDLYSGGYKKHFLKYNKEL